MNEKRKSGVYTPPSTDDLGRVQPQAPELERAILGALLVEREALDTALTVISSDMFYVKANAVIFEAIVSLAGEDKQVDIFTVKNRLQTEGRLEEVGGAYYITSLTSGIVSSLHLLDHCLIVKDKYLKRKIVEMSYHGVDAGYDETQETDEVIAGMNAEIERLQEMLVGDKGASSLSEVSQISLRQMEERMRQFREGVPPGIPTGFADLDRMTNGWGRQWVVILAARPSVGKTSVAVHMAKKAATKGYAVVFFSLEMSKENISDKIILSETDVNAGDFSSGNLGIRDSEEIREAAMKVSALPIHIEDNPRMRVQNIVSRARLLKKQGKCDMVIIDYLQLITPDTRQGRNRENEVSEISRLLKLGAKELDVPFIVLCQMNRDIEAEKREPRLSDLRESGAIEQDADAVIFIQRKGMYNDQVIDKGTGLDITNRIELFVRKNRFGRLGTVYISHDGSMKRFYDWDNGASRQFPGAQENYDSPYGDSYPF